MPAMPSYTEYKYGVQAVEPRAHRGLADRLFAWRYTRFSQPVEYASRKRALFAGLHGDVLEIGPGPGANFPYLPSGVRWIGLEPNVHMHDRLRVAAGSHG